jgi:hypothetical protein
MSPDDAPPSSGELPPIRARRWPIVVVLVAVAGVAVGAFFLVSARMARASQEREAKAWATLQRCLVGDEPLAAGERPHARLRRIQLTAVGIAWRAKGQDAWPGWCSPHAHALHEALREAGHAQEGQKDLSYWAEHLGKQLHDHPYPETDIGVLADALWLAAGTQGLSAAAPDEVPAVPAAATPLTVETLPQAAAVSRAVFPFDRVHDERVSGEALRLLVEESPTAAPFVCTARAGDDALACVSVPSSVKDVHVRMLGAAEPGAAPLLFAVPSGEAGIFRAADGSLFDEAASYGGLVRADGFAAELAWDKLRQQFRLRRGRAGQPPRDTSFKLDGVQDDAQVAMLWDAVVWAANDAVSVRHVLDGDAPMGAAAVVAPVPEGGVASSSPLRACKTAQAMGLYVHGVESDTVTIDTGERWSTPATFGAISGRAEALTCRGTELTFTALRAMREAGWIEGSVTQVRCTPGACTPKTTTLAKVFPDAKETMPVGLAAAGLDDKLLLVWQAGHVGGLRMRLAPQEAIEQAPDVVLYDDWTEEGTLGPANTLLGWRLFARGTFAVLLVSTVNGLHALRVDGSGKATPMRVTWPT